jgi:hypothetical protein
MADCEGMECDAAQGIRNVLKRERRLGKGRHIYTESFSQKVYGTLDAFSRIGSICGMWFGVDALET